MINIDDQFHKLFPTFDFELNPLQKQVVQNVIDGENTLCILQTGGGKSLIYWLSGLLLGGTTIVISPLTALINEQADKLNELGTNNELRINAVAISGNVPVRKQVKLFTEWATKKTLPDFIFLSPEKMATDGYLEACLNRIKDKIKLIVIDEIHCVSQWGISFRPFYQRIPHFLDTVFGNVAWPRVLGLTATLNPQELNDICNYFKFSGKNVIKQELLMRSEIQLHVTKFTKEEEKNPRLLEIFKIHRNEKILVYVYRKYNKHGVEDLCQFANDNGFNAAYFHGDMSAEERSKLIDAYKNGEFNIVFATNAFGMGIDIPDIKVVVHFMIPESVEQYYQEIGRAARKLKSANAYLFYSNKNIDVKNRYFIDGSFPSKELLKRVFKKLVPKRGNFALLQYFEDEEIQTCLPYFEEAGVMKIDGKVFAVLDNIEDIKNAQIAKYVNASETKNLLTISKKFAQPSTEIAKNVYSAVIDGSVKLKKPFDRYLLLKFFSLELSDNHLDFISKSIEDKKQYKHKLLDYLVYLISGDDLNSLELHQDIARYLGTAKFNLKKLHRTLDGNQVRSKSEVIICNLLYNNKISYTYEKTLKTPSGEFMSPDFTIELPDGTEIYWEHLGMIGQQEYSKDWIRKLDLYDKYFPDQLIYTYESCNLSQDAQELLERKILKK
ncbi:MAG: helicase-related protein [Phascolarctobacterium sp.]|nr:helicase-related protein [Phascolarctobacterium sp.]